MADPQRYPRLIRPRLIEALSDTPVVLVHGPRQCGKTTLVQEVAESEGYAYHTFDDDVLLAAVQADPVGFVADLRGRAVLDEVQRAPALFTTLKAAVDRDPEPGRFLLTGSANVLLLPQLADSLAGRMEVLRLHPLAQAELEGGSGDFIDRLFGGGLQGGAKGIRLGAGLAERIASGGYPRALARETPRRRTAWHRDYVESLVQRDVRDLTRISRLDALPRLLAVAASQTSRLINVTELSAPFELSRPTIREYLTLLEQLFLLEEIPPWHSNRLSRLVKRPKLHMADTGLAAALVGVDADGLLADRGLLGQMVETFALQELRRLASWSDSPVRFHHFRDKDGVEVDLVLERAGGGEVAGVEVKASSTVTETDFRGLQKVREASGKRFSMGVLLYDGELTLSFGENLLAVPISRLWGKG